MDSILQSEYRRLTDERPSPAYLNLRQAIRSGIEHGELAAGQALPSERELARQLSVSRVTVRKAITGLVADGALVQRQGAGTFVAERIIKPLSQLTSFTEDLRSRGLNPRSVFLEREVGEATPEEAMAMNLSPGARVTRLYRLRYSDDQPLAVERTAVPHSLLPDPEAVVDSLYEALRALGRRPIRALQRLRAVNFSADQARLLQVPRGSAGLAIERRGFLWDGELVEYTRSWYRGDSYDFAAELRNAPSAYETTTPAAVEDAS